MTGSNKRRPILSSLVVRRECWTLSGRGRLLAAGVAISIVLAIGWGAHPFLAVTERLDARVLILEGWLPRNVTGAVAEEFKTGRYQRLVVVCSSYGQMFYKDGRAQDLLQVNLIDRGVPAEAVDMLYCPEFDRNRTYRSALEAKRWLSDNDASTVNVMTLGAHARRSWLTYREALGDSVAVGIIALDDPSYDRQTWWRFTEGIEKVPWEIAGYAYARLFFIWN